MSANDSKATSFPSWISGKRKASRPSPPLTVQTAFRELEHALIATRKIREQAAAQDRQIQGQQRTRHLATLRYENGYSNYLEVLDAQRSLFNVELQQVQLQRARLGALVNLYKALGGDGEE